MVVDLKFHKLCEYLFILTSVDVWIKLMSNFGITSQFAILFGTVDFRFGRYEKGEFR